MSIFITPSGIMEAKLTQRERFILSLVGKGFLHKEIADQLSISTETVKKHLGNTYKKLNARNKVEALLKVSLLQAS